MQKSNVKISRREQILAALAKMLENSPGERITTSSIAKEVGVSEAALYRHFPSKTKMFEGLIESIEDTIFSRITAILAEDKPALIRCEKILLCILHFAEQNSGLSRLLIGDALTGETERLRTRIAQFHTKLAQQLAQLLGMYMHSTNTPPAAYVNLLLVYIDGYIVQYVRSEFSISPLQHWNEQWPLLLKILDTQRV